MAPGRRGGGGERRCALWKFSGSFGSAVGEISRNLTCEPSPIMLYNALITLLYFLLIDIILYGLYVSLESFIVELLELFLRIAP